MSHIMPRPSKEAFMHSRIAHAVETVRKHPREIAAATAVVTSSIASVGIVRRVREMIDNQRVIAREGGYWNGREIQREIDEIAIMDMPHVEPLYHVRGIKFFTVGDLMGSIGTGSFSELRDLMDKITGEGYVTSYSAEEAETLRRGLVAAEHFPQAATDTEGNRSREWLTKIHFALAEAEEQAGRKPHPLAHEGKS